MKNELGEVRDDRQVLFAMAISSCLSFVTGHVRIWFLRRLLDVILVDHAPCGVWSAFHLPVHGTSYFVVMQNNVITALSKKHRNQSE